jgi:hypothetical protein
MPVATCPHCQAACIVERPTDPKNRCPRCSHPLEIALRQPPARMQTPDKTSQQQRESAQTMQETCRQIRTRDQAIRERNRQTVKRLDDQ